MTTGLTLDGYQACARATAIYPGQGTSLGLIYVALKLTGDDGVLREIVGRENESALDDEGVLTPERRDRLVAEIGDVLW